MKKRTIFWSKFFWIVLLLVPLLALMQQAITNNLGVNPQEKLIRELGEWALRLLLLTLVITPFRIYFNWARLASFRRATGVITFLYASLHLLTYASFDMGWDLSNIGSDITKRPFILVGFLAWLLMVPLALTSFNAAIRWLGGKKWQKLHKAVYVIAIFTVIHFYWIRSGKNHYTEVTIYTVILGLLLMARMKLIQTLLHRGGSRHTSS